MTQTIHHLQLAVSAGHPSPVDHIGLLDGNNARTDVVLEGQARLILLVAFDIRSDGASSNQIVCLLLVGGGSDNACLRRSMLRHNLLRRILPEVFHLLQVLAMLLMCIVVDGRSGLAVITALGTFTWL